MQTNKYKFKHKYLKCLYKVTVELSVVFHIAAESGLVAVVLENILYIGIGGAIVLIMVGALVVGFCRCYWMSRHKRHTPAATR